MDPTRITEPQQRRGAFLVRLTDERPVVRILGEDARDQEALEPLTRLIQHLVEHAVLRGLMPGTA